MARALRMGLVAAACVLGAAAGLRAAEEQMPVVFQQDFEQDGALDKWEPMDPAAWKIDEKDGNHFLSMFQDSKFKTKVRSPINFGLIRDLTVRDFVLDLRMQSTTKDYGHRDLCLFFGYQDPTHFYYVHMALAGDPNAHSVFIVNDKARTSLIGKPGENVGGKVFRTKGIVWGDEWRHVRLVRKVAEGTVAVYFDDMANPIMRAEDKAFAWGRIGVGSFDDTGNYDDIVIRGIKVEPPKEKQPAGSAP